MELVLRIIVETDTPGQPGTVQVLTQPQGGIAMPASAAPVSAAPAVQAEPRLRELLDQYLAWGRIQGGNSGGPWCKDHERQTRNRCGWWLEKLNAERAALGPLPLVLVEQLAQKVGRILDRKGRVKPVAQKTRRDYLCALLTWRTWCEMRDLIRIPSPDPLRALRKPSAEPETEWRGLTADEFQRLLGVASLARREMYSMMALTGLRRREFRELKVRFLDKARQRLMIPVPGNKNGKASIVPLPPQIYPLVEKRAEGKTGDEDLYVFKKDWLTRMFDRDCEAAEIERVTPEGKAVLHGMRDTASSVLQQMGYSLSLACKFARHGDERLTRKRYTNISATEVAGAAADLGDRLNIADLMNLSDPASPAAPAFQAEPRMPKRRGIAETRRDTLEPQSLRAPEAKPDSVVVKEEHGGRGGIRTPQVPPIVILNVLPNYGLADPRQMQEQFAGGVGQGLGELAGVLAVLPVERQGEAVRALLEVARAFASAPAGEAVLLTTQLLQIDSAAARGAGSRGPGDRDEQDCSTKSAAAVSRAAVQPPAAAVPPIMEGGA